MLDILIISSFITNVAIIYLCYLVVDLKTSCKETGKYEDKDFIWILEKKRLLKYNKNKDHWTVMSPPF